MMKMMVNKAEVDQNEAAMGDNVALAPQQQRSLFCCLCRLCSVLVTIDELDLDSEQHR